MRLSILFVFFCCCFTGSQVVAGDDNTFTLYLVRHAEKQADGSRDPALTEAGQHRAQQLAGWLKEKGIVDIWSSDYKRTRDTAKPLAKALGTDLTIYDPGRLAVLAKQLRKNSRNAYIVGHSNTTPELARLLCKCPIADMDESEYDRLLEVSVDGNKTQVKTLQQNHLPQP